VTSDDSARRAIVEQFIKDRVRGTRGVREHDHVWTSELARAWKPLTPDDFF
jgi:hypothetical protein